MIENIGLSGITGPIIKLREQNGNCLHGIKNDRPHKIFYIIKIFNKNLFENILYNDVWKLNINKLKYTGQNNDELYITKSALDELLLISKSKNKIKKL